MPRVCLCASAAAHENLRASHGSGGLKGGTRADALEAVLQGRHVIRDLDHVGDRNARCRFDLEQEQVGEGRLCPLDLGRDHRFLSDVAVQKQFRVREQGRDAIEAAKGYERTVESVRRAAVMTKGGSGGSACGTNARTTSPVVEALMYVPVGPRCDMAVAP